MSHTKLTQISLKLHLRKRQALAMQFSQSTISHVIKRLKYEETATELQ